MRLLSKHSFPTESLRISHCRCYKTFYLERDTFKVDPLVSQISSHNNSAGGCRWTDSCLFRREEPQTFNEKFVFIQGKIASYYSVDRRYSGHDEGKSRRKLREIKRRKTLVLDGRNFDEKVAPSRNGDLFLLCSDSPTRKFPIWYFLIDNIYVILIVLKNLTFKNYRSGY